jgi:hypothetical protein
MPILGESNLDVCLVHDTCADICYLKDSLGVPKATPHLSPLVYPYIRVFLARLGVFPWS